MILIVTFLLGLKKNLTYGLVFIFHAISTLSCYQQYATPYQGNHLLFFAALPMLAACLTLYLMRHQDKILTFG